MGYYQALRDTYLRRQVWQPLDLHESIIYAWDSGAIPNSLQSNWMGLVNYRHKNNRVPLTFEISRTTMIRGRRARLFVSSSSITQADIVSLMDPPRNDAAPRRA